MPSLYLFPPWTADFLEEFVGETGRPINYVHPHTDTPGRYQMCVTFEGDEVSEEEIMGIPYDHIEDAHDWLSECRHIRYMDDPNGGVDWTEAVSRMRFVFGADELEDVLTDKLRTVSMIENIRRQRELMKTITPLSRVPANNSFLLKCACALSNDNLVNFLLDKGADLSALAAYMAKGQPIDLGDETLSRVQAAVLTYQAENHIQVEDSKGLSRMRRI